MLTPVEPNWRMIGKYLRISSKVLDKIEKNPRHLRDSANHLVEMVHQWLSLNYNYEQFGMPCWKLLVMAVAKGSGDNTYAIEIARKYRCEALTIMLSTLTIVFFSLLTDPWRKS